MRRRVMMTTPQKITISPRGGYCFGYPNMSSIYMTFIVKVEPASLDDDVVWTIGSETTVVLENCKGGNKSQVDYTDVLGSTAGSSYYRSVVLNVSKTGDGRTCEALIRSVKEKVPCYVGAYLKSNPEICDRVLLSYNQAKAGQPME